MKCLTTERVLEIARQYFGIGHASAAAILFENFAAALEDEIIDNINLRVSQQYVSPYRLNPD